MRPAVKVQAEADIARKVVTELQCQGYDTYEEVSLGYGGQRADVVAVRGRLLMVVECKTSLSLRLLDQLTGWRGNAHYILGAVGTGRCGSAADGFLRGNGFGLWMVCYGEIHEKVSPRLNRTIDDKCIRRALHEAQRSGAYARAGSMAGGYWTPFRETCSELLRVVKGSPGIELREALKAIQHHYATTRSAASSVPPLIRSGVIDGLEVKGVPLRLYPKGHGPIEKDANAASSECGQED
jgi:hypothetical protein